MNRRLREYFDRQVHWVLKRMPEPVHALLDEIPMYVEDYPSRQVLRDTGVRGRRNLCGLHTGIPLPDQHLDAPGTLSEAIYLYREGLLSLATADDGEVDRGELRRQIRLTILHELGHHHGLTEAELRALGY
jgi:predicted Zn-dependent protease with MMP-like domain